MNKIFPYLLVGLVGFFGGGLVNYIVEWYYLRRHFLSVDCSDEIHAKGLARFVVWPWGFEAFGYYKKIRLLIVELVFIFLAIWLWFFPSTTFNFWWAFGLMVYFAIVVIMDMEYKVVLHPISMAGGIIGLIFGIWYHQDFIAPIAGGVVGFAIMFVFYKLGELFVRRMNKRRGLDPNEVALGFGDVNMAGVVGLMLGFPAIIVGLFIAVLAGGFVSILYLIIMLLLRRLKAFEAIPYAPFIVLAAILILYFPDFLTAILNSN